MQIRQVNPSSLKQHPLAHLVPDMRPSEWQDFYNDVAARGIKVPLEILGDGTVVDGRHRLKAALALGMKLVPVLDAPLNGDQPDVYMLKAAVLRRHLTDDQRACIAELWKEKYKIPDGKRRGLSVAPRGATETIDTRAQASETFRVSRKKMAKAAQIRQTDPELFEAVHRGETTLNKAYQRVDKARKAPALKAQYPVGIRQGDFRKVLSDIPDKSVKLILTDPPYGKDYLPLWDDLGAFAARVLREDGALIAYSGQLYLPYVMKALERHLDWWWLSGVVHKGSSNLTPLGQPVRKVINQFKPILMFVQHGGGLDNVFRDLVDGEGPSKEQHNWGQPIGEAHRILQTFCHPGDLVVDPFAGSGAIGVAATELGLQFIGAEILNNDPSN
jgi:site-specific DNA-methyltransferase (adenine-specific)